MVATLLAWVLGLGLALAPPDTEPTQPPPASESGTRARAPAPAPRYETVVSTGRGGEELDAQRDLAARNVGFVTAIDLDLEPGQAPADDLAGVISRAPGVTVRSVGGLGQFSAVSLRGSSVQQAPVFLDGAPLTSSLGGTVDLSTQPLDALEEIDVYRGYVPVVYGAGAIGGAIDLVGRVHKGAPTLSARLGFGSFLARDARVAFATELGRGLSLALRAGYAGSKGDFSYYDVGNTPRIADDDRTRRRINNGYDRVFAQLRLDGRRGLLRVAHQDLVWLDLQQIPAAIGNPDSDADQRTLVVRSITRVRQGFGSDAPGGYVEWIGSAVIERRRFIDPLAQIGLAADDERALGLEGWLSPRLRVPVWPSAWLLLGAELRGEWLRIDEREPEGALASGDATRSRVSAGFGAELEQVILRRWSLVPSVRIDLADSHFAVPPGEGEEDDRGSDRVILAASPRLGTKLELYEGVELRGSGGRYLRLPTLTELFGDRGYLIGNEALRPESGWVVDGGVQFDLAALRARSRESDEPDETPEVVDVFVQLAGFATWTDDLIQWLRSGPIVQPVNVAGARVRGLESGASLRLWQRTLMLDLAYTLLDTRNDTPELEQRGQPLPGRPRHTLLARLAGGWRFSLGPRAIGLEPRALYELEWIAGNVLDLSGRVELPPRVLHRLGVELIFLDRVRLSFEARNLADRRVLTIHPQSGPSAPYPAPIADFLGYPLPGRSFWATLGVDLELPRRRERRHPR